jgi:hypothetical protein
MNAVERNAKIDLYGRGFALLVEVLELIPREAWQFRPAPQEWSIHEIVIHLADSETNAALRARKLAVEPGGMLMGYDQDKWARDLNYHDQNPDNALVVTQYARLTTYNWLKTLPDEVFTHTCKHPEYDEPYSFEQWLDIYSAHIPGHIEKIKNNFEVWRRADR